LGNACLERESDKHSLAFVLALLGLGLKFYPTQKALYFGQNQNNGTQGKPEQEFK